jgi:hypothetical protein
MPTEGIPADHGARDIERVEKSRDVSGELRDGHLAEPRIEDGQRERHGPALIAQILQHRLPVIHPPHEPVEEHHRLALSALQPSELRIRSADHAVLRPARIVSDAAVHGTEDARGV